MYAVYFKGFKGDGINGGGAADKPQPAGRDAGTGICMFLQGTYMGVPCQGNFIVSLKKKMNNYT